MLYQNIYDKIIHRAKQRQLLGYGEKHHITPRCLGGSDDKDNIVKLTYREHFLCHKLLCKIHPGNLKLIYAISFMVYKSKTQQRLINSKDFDYVKRMLAPHMGQWNKGREPWNKGLTGDKFKEKNPNHSAPPNMTGYKWINNGIKQTKLAPNNEIPEGWSFGRLDNRGDNNGMRKKNVI
jgi:hypothetical protein